MTVKLYGYQYSVSSWIARLALEEKGTGYHWTGINPCAPDVPESYLALHPFERVPTLVHDGFQVYELVRSRYIGEAFPGPRLQPADPRHRARCSQILCIVDSYVYWPLVRQVFPHRIFNPPGRPYGFAEVQKGFGGSTCGACRMERLAADAEYLCGADMSLADIHLAPMIGYFAMAEGKATRC